MAIFIIILLVLLIAIFVPCITIVPQAKAYVIERLGAYQGTWNVGFHIKLPVIDRVAKRVNLKELVADFPPQPVITKDNVTMSIDSVVFYQITDPKLFVYGVENPMLAIENLTATTLRNIIGDMELDQTLTSRETINTQMRAALDLATDPWGIKVNRVEREAVTRAEGEKRAKILEAEGEKESAILRAEADKAAAILRADAAKEKMIREAEGEAQAIKTIQQANADGIRMLREAGADEAVLKLKSLEAFEKVADGQATTILLPAELQGIASVAATLKETAK